MRVLHLVAVAGLALALPMLPAAASAADPAPVADAAQPKPYSTATTTIGALIDDPAAKAVVDKVLPGVLSNERIDMVRDRTLKEIQPAFRGRLSDEMLAQIDAELAKLPVKP